MIACHDFCMWLRKTNSSGSSATHDDRNDPAPAQQNAAPARSNASLLLSAAQIWSNEATITQEPEFVSEPVVSEPLISEPIASAAPATSEVAEAQACVAESASEPSEFAPVVAEMIMAATHAAVMSETKAADIPERTFAETIATATLPPPPRTWPPRKLSLALQGGGTFSAFTWGVLDRLLQEPGCDFDTISGASAGAINAALLASGLANHGREDARNRLAQFWTRLTEQASFRSLMVIGGYSPASSAVSFGSGLRGGRADPFDLDPLREMLADTIDFDAARSANAPRLLVAATRVRDGLPQIFRNAAITPDVLLASTCPAQLHGAVDIDDEAYWDGGYAANPPLVQIAHESSAADLLVVQVTPAQDGYVPVTSLTRLPPMPCSMPSLPRSNGPVATACIRRVCIGLRPKTRSRPLRSAMRPSSAATSSRCCTSAGATPQTAGSAMRHSAPPWRSPANSRWRLRMRCATSL